MIQILLDHWEFVVELVVFIGGAVGLYFKVRGQISTEINELKMDVAKFKSTAVEHWDRQNREFDRIEGRMDDHEKDPLPHASCPAHAQALADIVPRLDRIQGDIASLRDDLGAFKTSILTIMTSSKKQ
jgi:hypothetical protein